MSQSLTTPSDAAVATLSAGISPSTAPFCSERLSELSALGTTTRLRILVACALGSCMSLSPLRVSHTCRLPSSHPAQAVESYVADLSVLASPLMDSTG